MDRKLESKLKSIEYRLETAQNVTSNSALVVHHARTDLLTVDVPYLLELVRSQALALEEKSTPDKRFTVAELRAEIWFMTWVHQASSRYSDFGGPSLQDYERLATLRRFASLPHYDEQELNDE